MLEILTDVQDKLGPSGILLFGACNYHLHFESDALWSGTQSQPSDAERLLYSLLSLPEALTLESLLCLCGI